MLTDVGRTSLAEFDDSSYGNLPLFSAAVFNITLESWEFPWICWQTTLDLSANYLELLEVILDSRVGLKIQLLNIKVDFHITYKCYFSNSIWGGSILFRIAAVTEMPNATPPG